MLFLIIKQKSTLIFYDNLPLEKTLTFHNVIVLKTDFNKGKKKTSTTLIYSWKTFRMNYLKNKFL